MVSALSARPVNSSVRFLLLWRVMRIVKATLTLLLLSAGMSAQTGNDACHVYLVDAVKSQQAFENFRETGDKEADAKALSVGQTLFPEFYPEIGEEKLTTKHYPFPGSKLVITASVYYTDETMESHPHGEFDAHRSSMLMGVSVGRKAKPDAISTSAGESSIVEVTYDQYTNIVRAKKYLTVRGRSYLVGIECDCMAEKREKDKRGAKPNNGMHPTPLQQVSHARCLGARVMPGVRRNILRHGV